MSGVVNFGDQAESNIIDENKLNEFDREVSNYLDEIMQDDNQDIRDIKDISDLEDLNNDDGEYNYNYEYEKDFNNNKRDIETENMNQILSQENKKLTLKIEEYIKLNRDWENKVYNIKKTLDDFEDTNNAYKEDNEKLKDDCEQLGFKLKLMVEKEKTNETCRKHYKELENEYENRNAELKNDYKSKEENLKKKYEKLDESVNRKVKDQEEELNEKIDKLNIQVKEYQKLIFKLENECQEYKEKLSETEMFFEEKEKEFDDLVNTKDSKLKELELCINLISNEANAQINKLSESVGEFNDKINYYKQREIQISNEYIELKNQMKAKTSTNREDTLNQYNPYISSNSINQSSNNIYQKNNVEVTSDNNRNNSIDFNNESKSKTIETLRSRIKELEEENTYLSRELNLKYEECDTLSEELRLSYDAIKNSEWEAQNLIKEKDDEVLDLTNKINQFDIIISKYGQNLSNIKKAYDKSSQDSQVDSLKKENKIKEMQENYEKKIRELQAKIQDILLRENVFIQKMNVNEKNDNLGIGINKKTEMKYSGNSYVYVPKEIPDDEEVRRNINEQINFIKEKLDRNYFQR